MAISDKKDMVCQFPNVDAYIINATPEFEEMASHAIAIALESLMGQFEVDDDVIIESLEPFAVDAGVNEDMIETVCKETYSWAYNGLLNIANVAVIEYMTIMLRAALASGELVNRLFIKGLDSNHLIIGVKDEANI